MIFTFLNSIHATALATFAETVGELGLLSSLKDDKDEITLVSLELEVMYTLLFGDDKRDEGVTSIYNIKSPPPLLALMYSLSRRQEDC